MRVQAYYASFVENFIVVEPQARPGTPRPIGPL
jgi:hypothetical protein